MADGVVPVLMVDILPQKLHGWLCSELLQRRHVHVIHEDDALLSNRRPIGPLPPLVQPGHEDILEEAMHKIIY